MCLPAKRQCVSVTGSVNSSEPVSSLPLPVWDCLDIDLAAHGRLCAISFLHHCLAMAVCVPFTFLTTATYIPGMADCVPFICYSHLHNHSLAWPIVCQLFFYYSHLFTTAWQWPFCVPIFYTPQYAVCGCSIFGLPRRFMAV